MIHIKCSKCNKTKWARVDKNNLTEQQKWVCKPCRKKAGIKDPARKPRFKKGRKVASPPKEKKKKGKKKEKK